MAEDTCSNCGAVYEVTYTRIIMSDSDSFDCCVCGVRAFSWSGASVPDYRLVKRPDKWPPDG